VATLLGVALNTVRAWADSGELTHRRTAGGHRRFVEADVLAFQARRLTGAPAHAAARAAAWASVADQVLRNAEVDLGRGSPLGRPFRAARAELERELKRAKQGAEDP
jgi:excisionase family DNA binding protein